MAGARGLCKWQTLRSRRSLVTGRAVTVVVCQCLPLRGRTLSTAASDAERERVCHLQSPRAPADTT